MFSSAFCYSSHEECLNNLCPQHGSCRGGFIAHEILAVHPTLFHRSVKLQLYAGLVPTENIFPHMTELMYCNVGNYPLNSFRQFLHILVHFVLFCSFHEQSYQD